MKKGINVWSMPENLSIQEQVDLAESAQFETIELNVAEAHEKSLDLSLATTPEELREIKRIIQNSSLKLESISTALHWTYPISAADSAVREQGIAIVKKMIDFADVLGANTVLVVPGLVTGAVDYQTCYQNSLESLKSAAAYAENKKVTIAVENVWNKFLLSPIEVKQFLQEISSDFVKFYFDVGNILQYGFPEQWIRYLGDHIAKIHLKDFREEIGNDQGFCNLFEGDVDWQQVMTALREIGYEGPLTCELSPYRSFPEKLVFDTSKSLDQLLSLN